MDAKEEAKEESKGSSLSREDLLKYIKRLKAKVKGLEDERAQTGEALLVDRMLSVRCAVRVVQREMRFVERMCGALEAC
jgi:hypothetical protein